MAQREMLESYARVAGWSVERQLELICEWLDDHFDDPHMTLDSFLASRLSPEQLATLLATLLGRPTGVRKVV